MKISNCLECYKEFKSQYKGSKFCSRSCAAKTNNRIFKKRELEGKCKCCNETIQSSRTYCKNCLAKGVLKDQLIRVSRTKFIYKGDRNQRRSGAVVSWRRRTKIKAVEYKGGSCVNCGYNKSINALQFHHLDPSQKDFGISGVSKSWETIKAELDKCILLCANCHFEEHDRLNKITKD